MKKSILSTQKPYRNPKWLQGQDKVDDLGPILGSSPKKSKVLSKKFQGCSIDMSDRNVISENDYQDRKEARRKAFKETEKSIPCTACSGYCGYKDGKCANCKGTGKVRVSLERYNQWLYYENSKKKDNRKSRRVEKFKNLSIKENIISEYNQSYDPPDEEYKFRPHNKEWLQNELDFATKIYNDKEYSIKDRKLAYDRIKFLKKENSSSKIAPKELKNYYY